MGKRVKKRNLTKALGDFLGLTNSVPEAEGPNSRRENFYRAFRDMFGIGGDKSKKDVPNRLAKGKRTSLLQRLSARVQGVREHGTGDNREISPGTGEKPQEPTGR